MKKSHWIFISGLSALPSAFSQSVVPGDQAPLKEVHPGFDLIPLRPDTWQPKVTGLDFLSDGRMVLLNYRPMEVYFVDGHLTNDRSKVTWKRFADGRFFKEPLGLAVVNDVVFVMDRDRLIRLVDKDKDGVAEEGATVCNSFGIDLVNGYQEQSYNLIHKDGFFYTGLGARMNGSGFVVDQQSPDRGDIIKINPGTGAHETFAKGLRSPNGLTVAPDGSIWGTDNQGSWLPANKLIHLRAGSFYGHHLMTRAATAADPKETRAAIYLEEGEIANSPGNPLFIPSGPYAGQFFVGDVKYGGIQRAYVERVAGEYQGCYFRHSAGMEAGVHKLAWGPDGALYAGMVGVCCGTHSWQNTVTGLQKLKPNGRTAFEMLRVKSRSQGMEIHFSEAVGEGALLAASYEVKSWTHQPSSRYGGPKVGLTTHEVKAVTLSPDRRMVYLEVAGLQAERIVYIRLLRYKSQGGRSPWSTEAYYTLNAIAASRPFAPEEPVLSALPRGGGRKSILQSLRQVDGGYRLVLADGAPPAKVRVLDARGRLIRESSLRPGVPVELTSSQVGTGLRFIQAGGEGGWQTRRVVVP